MLVQCTAVRHLLKHAVQHNLIYCKNKIKTRILFLQQKLHVLIFSGSSSGCLHKNVKGGFYIILHFSFSGTRSSALLFQDFSFSPINYILQVIAITAGHKMSKIMHVI
jgi:hypothetical protein